jgi:hypothetical protein
MTSTSPTLPFATMSSSSVNDAASHRTVPALSIASQRPAHGVRSSVRVMDVIVSLSDSERWSLAQSSPLSPSLQCDRGALALTTRRANTAGFAGSSKWFTPGLSVRLNRWHCIPAHTATALLVMSS